MASKVQIWNLALRFIGETPVNSPTEDDDNADILSDIYDLSRQAALRQFPWSFALDTAELANDSSVDSPDYSYAYLLPSDSLYIVRLIPPGATDETYQIRNRHMHTDATEVYVEYVRDEEDTTKFDSLFIQAFAYYLASQIAITRTGKADMVQLMTNGYNRVISMARGMNASESRLQHTQCNSLVTARD